MVGFVIAVFVVVVFVKIVFAVVVFVNIVIIITNREEVSILRRLHTLRQTDIATNRLNRTRGPWSEKPRFRQTFTRPGSTATVSSSPPWDPPPCHWRRGRWAAPSGLDIVIAQS